jgi:hypothetical protein
VIKVSWMRRQGGHEFDFFSYAPVAQLDRVPGYEPGGREFESLRARHSLKTAS